MAEKTTEFIIGALYCRVSTDDQAEYSIPAQIKIGLEYAKKNNIIIPKEYIFIDEGISGKSAEKRPAFQNMISIAKTKPKPFETIIIHKFDRFARSREDSIVYKSLLRKECGISVVSITESIEDNKFSIILEAMLEAMAEYYSLNLSEEVKKGMTEKAERGEIQTKASFGYKMVNGNLEIEPEEAKIVRFIFEQMANRTMTQRQLAVYINDLGIKSKQGNQFENRSIDYIVNNPLYMGKVRWTPTHRIRRDFNNPDCIIRDGTHEPIVSVELWEQVQEVIKENKELYPKHSKSHDKKIHSWVNGLVYCGNCGYSLVNSQNKYLQCNGYSKGKCKKSCSVKYSIIESAVLEELRSTFTEPINIEIVPKASDHEKSNEHEILTQSLVRIREKLQRIKEAYQDGIDTLDEYKEQKGLIESDLDKIQKKLKALKDSLLEPENDANIQTRIEDVYSLLTDPNIDIKRKYEVAHFLIHKIIYTKQDKIIKLIYK